MHLGVIFPQTEIGPDPGTVQRFVRTADEVGFEYLVAYDHVLGADTESRPGWQGPYTFHSQFHEPFVLFGYIAAVTDLELVTGVLILPQRQAVLVAKQAAEVDVLSGGRLRLGVGIGWNDIEYQALGVDFASRATLYEEQVELMRRLWTEETVTFEGSFHHVDRAGILPRPVQQPIPVWMGGGTRRPVLERIGRQSDGWICNTPPGRGLEEALPVVRAAAAQAGRSPDAVGLQGIVTAGDPLDVERLQRQAGRWEAAGATHLSVSTMGAGRSPEAHADCLAEAIKALRG